MTRQEDFYKHRLDKDKPPSFILKTLPEGTLARVQKKFSDWSLIAAPKHKEAYHFLEGRVRTKDLEEVAG
jgi:hypothetical protein